jgi:hypothetical protein
VDKVDRHLLPNLSSAEVWYLTSTCPALDRDGADQAEVAVLTLVYRALDQVEKSIGVKAVLAVERCYANTEYH